MEDECKVELTNFDDDLTAPAAHNKLLGAVSALYDKKRVQASTRKEPSLEVSEFHLTKADQKHSRIKITELAKVLNKRGIHTDIGNKIRNAQKRAKPLSKPLEKIHQDKINRKAGFEHAKQRLNRWDAIVYKHKVAEQLTFPLQSSDTIKVYNTADVSTLFRKPTELEIALGKILNKTYEEPQTKETIGAKNQDEGEYPLTLSEMKEKRKMMAKWRAQQSYQQSKAARQSKIKSKKYHQIKRRERVKEQLREFEELQKKDPEAALKKLEELERTRAEERVTLRHRSTGQWAKNLAVRAKYDKDARIALAEQLSKSKELTLKIGKSQESESEKEVEEEENQSEREDDPNNPWVLKQSKEMSDFVSGYRKYWETKGKELETKIVDNTATKTHTPDRTKTPTDENIDKENVNTENLDAFSKEDVNSKITVETFTNHAATNNNTSLNENSLTEDQSKDKKHSCSTFGLTASNEKHKNGIKIVKTADAASKIGYATAKTEKSRNERNKTVSVEPNKMDTTIKKVNSFLSKNLFIVNDCTINNNNEKNQIKNSPCSTFIVTDSAKQNKNDSIDTTTLVEHNAQLNSNVGSWIISINMRKNQTQLKCKNKEQKQQSNMNSFFNITASKVYSSICENLNHKPLRHKNKSLDELFEEVEGKIQSKIRNKMENLKKSLSLKMNIEDNPDPNPEQEELPRLEFKKLLTPADVDEELLEIPQNKLQENKEKDLAKNVQTDAELKQTENIDPNKFLKLKQRHLLSQVPDIMSEGDDALDNEEKVREDRHLTISEAFADDDVVDEFQREKTELFKKSQVSNVDLTLPGWGSWAGHNMRRLARRKRKKFVIKFPKNIPRKDSNRGNVIINEDADKPIKEHQVSELPYPFTSVEEYEASIRAPLGTTWVPHAAHTKLVAPAVVTKMGAVIAPMDESQLVSKDDSTPRNKKKKLKPVTKKSLRSSRK